jgi:dienelactone hydrolase
MTELLPYQDEDENLDAFIARPDGEGPHPAVLVCHAWGGRGEAEEEKARRLAELGYIGVALDLYGVGKRGHDRASSQALMTSLLQDPSRLRRRLTVAVDAALALDGVDGARVAAIGYCFGGMCSILLARLGLPLRGVVSFHGLLKVGAGLDAEPKARILVLHGQDDPMVPPADVAAFAEEMKRIDADWELHAYPRVMHAFTNPNANDPDFGTVYDAGADARSWSAMTRFLEDVLA